MRILYLDLHPEYISGKTDEVLRNRGHMLFQVSTCSEALEMIRSQDFDVVVVAQDSLAIVNFIAKARGIRGELPVLLADDWGVTDLPAPSPGVRPASNCCFSIGWTTLVLRVSSPSIREETTPTIIGMYSCPAGVEAGQIYGFRAFGPFEPDRGLRFEPSKLLLGELSPFSPDSLPNLQQTIVVMGFFGSDSGHSGSMRCQLSIEILLYFAPRMHGRIVTTLAENPILTLFIVIGLGYLLGEISVFGFRFGTAGVLFVGLAVGSLGPAISIPEVIPTLGLIIFIYTIGIQSGPEFFKSLREGGYRDGVFALVIVVLGAGARPWSLVPRTRRVLALPASTPAP